MRKNRKIILPIGVFISSLIIFETLAFAATGILCLVLAKQDIYTLEKEARSFLIPILDVCVTTATVGSDADVSKELSVLFTDYQKKGLVYRAFFVKENGEIIAHSSSAERAALNNNIAKDEFNYNLEQIFLPLRIKELNTVFLDYFIPDISQPFHKTMTARIKKYVYSEIDKNGWLIEKAVFRKDKPYGMVSFIVEKAPIYRAIQNRYDQFIFWILRAGIAAGIASFILALIMLIRYNTLIKNTFQTESGCPENTAASSLEKTLSGIPQKAKPEKIFIEDEPRKGKGSFEILDAIPVHKKRI